jgi:hypothetical protein
MKVKIQWGMICLISLVFTLRTNGQCLECSPSNYSTKIGYNNSINPSFNYQTVVGNNSSITNGTQNFVFGSNCTVSETSAFAIGTVSQALGVSSFTIGHRLKSQNSGAFVLGIGASSTLPLINSVSSSLVIGFNSQYPTFFVSSSNGIGTTGRIGIGNVTNPSAKLHIKADANEDASLKLDATGTGKISVINFSPYHLLKAANDSNFTFQTQNGTNFLFTNGKVGIGTNNPEAEMHVNGSMQIGSANDPGQLRIFGSINSEATSAFAFGSNNTASGSYSFAGGNSSIASGLNSFAFGNQVIASNDGAFASGFSSTASGILSFAFGNQVTAAGASSVAIGRFLQTATSPAFVLGCGFDLYNKLINDVPNSLMVGFNSNRSTLFVGPSVAANYTGKVGVGYFNNGNLPSAKLHIKADANEDADLLLETSSSENTARLILSNDHTIEAKQEDHLYFTTADGKDFIFHQGDVFLDDIQSGIIMKSPNGQCWRGIMTDQGSLNFTQIACPDENTAVNTYSDSQKLILYPNPTSGKLIVETEISGEQKELILCSIDGKILSRQKLVSEKTEINTESYKSGTYMMQLVQNNKIVASEKLLIK